MSAIPIENLTAAERLALISKLWDSLDPSDVPVTPAQREELDRRLQNADTEIGKTWEQLGPIRRRR
jgi:putative addiction module component (TIGR02574 family)